MAVLFENHATTLRTAAVFADAGCSLERRVGLRTSLPGLQFVSAGMCYMVCDIITAYGYIVHDGTDRHLVVRRFRPVIRNSVSILTPGYATTSLTTRAFSENPERSIHGMCETMDPSINGTPSGA